MNEYIFQREVSLSTYRNGQSIVIVLKTYLIQCPRAMFMVNNTCQYEMLEQTHGCGVCLPEVSRQSVGITY